jgi:hypothetical protein
MSVISIEMLLKEKQLKNWHKDWIEVYKTKQWIKRFIFEFINVAQDEILK